MNVDDLLDNNVRYGRLNISTQMFPASQFLANAQNEPITALTAHYKFKGTSYMYVMSQGPNFTPFGHP